LPSSVDEADSEEEKRPCEESKTEQEKTTENERDGRSKKKQPQICTDNPEKKEISDE